MKNISNSTYSLGTSLFLTSTISLIQKENNNIANVYDEYFFMFYN